MPSVIVNGAELYYEVRGTGPPVLLIMGATGDGGHFDALADMLADEFTVVTYDRRGNGRSPVPAGWKTTSVEEQADDAAALLEALGTGPATVSARAPAGTSRCVCWSAIPDGCAARSCTSPGSTLWSTISTWFEPRCGRWPRRRWRPLGRPPQWSGSGVTWLAKRAGTGSLRRCANACAPPPALSWGVELGTYELYLPDDQTLTSLAAPVRLLVSEDSLPYLAEIAGRFGQRVGVEVATTPGGHDAYHEYPKEFSAAVRPFLNEVSAARV